MLKNIDCSSTAEQYDFKPVYYACFDWKSLPSQFNAKIGPVTNVDPEVDCPALGYPTTQIDIVLVRQGCSYVWSWSNGQIGFILSTGIVAPLMTGNPNMPDISQPTSNSTYWYVQNSSGPITGSCSYNPLTNETTFYMSGTVVEDPGCSYPFIITYNGV